jgi:hypothetical protein
MFQKARLATLRFTALVAEMGGIHTPGLNKKTPAYRNIYEINYCEQHLR